MSEQFDEQRVEMPESGDRTGNAAVDAVVRSTDGLDEQPVGAHVEIFETAHDSLRAVLADAGSDQQRP